MENKYGELKIENLHAGYGDLEILKGVNIEVGNGEIVALIGPNGAGKSTVIKAIFGIADIYEGEIKFGELDLRKLKTHELIQEGICYVNQGKIIFNNLTVRENLEIGATEIKCVKENVEKVYARFPFLKEREKSYAYELSGGQRQMLALGRALMQKPKLLLLDEPSLGLSPILQKEIFEMIKKLNSELGMSILIVEQNAKKAIQTAHRTYLLEDGKIVLEASGSKLLRNKKIKEVYLGGGY